MNREREARPCAGVYLPKFGEEGFGSSERMLSAMGHRPMGLQAIGMQVLGASRPAGCQLLPIHRAVSRGVCWVGTHGLTTELCTRHSARRQKLWSQRCDSCSSQGQWLIP